MLSAAITFLTPDHDTGRFMLTRLDYGEENVHNRFSARVIAKEKTREDLDKFFMGTVLTYKDCTPI